MIAFIIKSTLCLIVLLGVYLIFLEREKMHQFNRFYLLGALYLGLLIPQINFEIDIVTHPDNKVLLLTESFETSSEVISVISSSSSEYVESIISPTTKTNESGFDGITKSENQSSEVTVQNSRSNNSPETSSIISPLSILIMVYAVVAYTLLIRMLFGLLSFYKIKKESTLTTYGSATLALASGDIVPHTFWNTIYVNKSQFESGKLNKQILDHELTHAKEMHSLDVILIELLTVVFWFNPIFYFYKKAIQINHEFLADDSVIGNTQDSTSYQQLLLGSVFPKYKTSLASTFNYSLTKKRFKMMVKEHSKLATVSKKLFVIPVLACIVFLFCTEISSGDKVYKIDGIKYVEPYRYDGYRSSELILNKVEDRENILNQGERTYYDRNGKPYTGELITYNQNKENKVTMRSEIKEGKLLTRVFYADIDEFSVLRSSYKSDTVSTALFSSENKLVGHNTIKINESISSILNQSIDSTGVWTEFYFIGSAINRDSLKDVTLGIKYDKERNIDGTYLYSNEGNIPLTKRYKEVATINAKKRYDATVSEYERLNAKGDKEQAVFAYQELINERSRWLAFRREFYKNELMQPIAPLPDPPSEL